MRAVALVILFVGCTVSVFSQVKIVSGTVLDERGSPLTGATLRLMPGNVPAYTDQQGDFRFSIDTDRTYTITVSHIGYAQQTIMLKHDAVEQALTISMVVVSGQLNTVTVQADAGTLRDREESMPVDVVSNTSIRKNLGGSLMQSIERLPGVSMIGIGSGQSKPLIRGLGFNRVVVVDKGVKHEGQQWGADHGLEIDQFAVYEADVVRGAASFVYGSDAIGGAIDLKPAPPPAQGSGGSVSLIAKSNNALYGTSVNAFARNGSWFVDTRVSHQDYGDYRVPTSRVYVYDYAVDLDRNRLRNSAGYETGLHLHTGYVGDSVQSVFYISHVSSASGFFANAHGLEPRRIDAAFHDRSSRDIQNPRQDVNHFKVINRSMFRVAGGLVETELGYQHNARKEFSHYINHGYMPAIYPADMTIPIDLERQFTKQVYSANVRYYQWWGRHSVTVGLSGEHQDNAIGGWSFLVPAFRQTTGGVFVYDKVQLNPHWLVHGALRYDFGQISMKRYEDWFASEATVDGQPVSINVIRADNRTRTFNNLVWSGGVNYTRGNLDLKANVGKSFRMPIAKELGANGVNYHYFSYERGDASLQPEQSYQGDIGIKWTGSRWTLGVTPFYNYFARYIYLNPTPQHDYFYGAGNQVFEYTQSEVARYGGELTFAWTFIKPLRFEVVGEYVRAKQLSGDKKGYTLPFSPPASALVNLTWSPALGNTLQDFYCSVDYRLTARQNNIVPPERITAGYQTINLQIGSTLNIGHYPVAINMQVRNLLNTRYLDHTSFYRLIGLPEAGRNFILSIHIPFTIKHKQQ